MRVALLAACLLAAGAAAAQSKLGEVLEGFDEEPAKAAPSEGRRIPENGRKERRFRLGGSVSEEASYRYARGSPAPGETDRRGLSGLRTRLDLEADVTLPSGWRGRFTGHAFYDAAYAIRGRDDFTRRFLDEYEREVEVGDAYLQGKLSSALDLRLGRQIVVWGKSDSIRVTDMLNPLDLRRPGRTDIEDLRLPVTMTRLDYFFGDWSITGVVVHEPRFNRVPVPGSDLFRGPSPPPVDRVRASFKNQEVGFALSGIFTGWDMAVVVAYLFDDQAHVERTRRGLRRRHGRIGMAGVSANVARGNWLLKGEAALLDGLEFLGAPGDSFTRLDVLAGVEYSGFRDATVTFEVANRHLFDATGNLRIPPDDGRVNDFETALRVTRRFLNETLEVTLLASTFGPLGGNGGFQRLRAAYDWSDSVEIAAGVINTLSGDKLRFRGAGDNDQAFLEIKFSF